MNEWIKFSEQWAPYDIPINIRIEYEDNSYFIKNHPFTLRHMPNKHPVACDDKLEFVIKGKKKYVGAFKEILINGEWKKYE